MKKVMFLIVGLIAFTMTAHAQAITPVTAAMFDGLAVGDSLVLQRFKLRNGWEETNGKSYRIDSIYAAGPWQILVINRCLKIFRFPGKPHAMAAWGNDMHQLNLNKDGFPVSEALFEKADEEFQTMALDHLDGRPCFITGRGEGYFLTLHPDFCRTDRYKNLERK